jgi:hypothetical protein
MVRIVKISKMLRIRFIPVSHVRVIVALQYSKITPLLVVLFRFCD